MQGLKEKHSNGLGLAAGVSDRGQKSLCGTVAPWIYPRESSRKSLFNRMLYGFLVAPEPGMWFAETPDRGAPWR